MRLKTVGYMDERQLLNVLENVGDTNFPAIVDEDGEVIAVLLRGSETTAKKLLGPLNKQLEKEEAARVLPIPDPTSPSFKVGDQVLFSASKMREDRLQVGTVKSIRWEEGRMVFPMAWYGRDDSITHQDTNVYVLETETYQREAAECELRLASQADIADHEAFWGWLRSLQPGDEVKLDARWYRGHKTPKIKEICRSSEDPMHRDLFLVTLSLDDGRDFQGEAYETLVGPDGQRGPTI